LDRSLSQGQTPHFGSAVLSVLRDYSTSIRSVAGMTLSPTPFPFPNKRAKITTSPPAPVESALILGHQLPFSIGTFTPLLKRISSTAPLRPWVADRILSDYGSHSSISAISGSANRTPFSWTAMHSR